MKIISVLFTAILIVAISFGTALASEVSGVEIHGFISQGYLLTDKNNYLADTKDGTFEFNEIGINFSKDFADSLRISMQIFSRDLGDIANNKVVLGYAYGDYRWKNWLGFRAGKIKLDYGLYNETREMDMLRTTVMLPQSIYPEIWRDSFSNINGVGLYGYTPGGFMGKLSYNVQIGSMEFKTEDGFAKFLTPRMNESLALKDIKADYAVFGSLQWHTPVPGLKAKGSYYMLEGLTADGILSVTDKDGVISDASTQFDFSRKDGYILSLEYGWKNLLISGEYSEDTYDFDVNFPSNQSAAPLPLIGGGPPKITSQGWNISASYRFTDWLESALSYSEYYPDKDHKEDKHQASGQDGNPPPQDKNILPHNDEFSLWLKTITLSNRFDINENWLIKLEGSYNDGFGGVNLAGNNNNDLSRYWWLFSVKATFSF